jgi:pimeloyl-ACP methyl ester carboxylesterase
MMTTRAIPPHWTIQTVNYAFRAGKMVSIRAGYIDAAPNTAFRGNILYYQGLSDSMLNHDPFFLTLAQAGYRVIAFDYMGQGGSQGEMNHTTLEHINAIGDQAWLSMARTGERAGDDRMNIIGWSTGGLAAYRKAYIDPDRVRSVVLIAPGIVLGTLVGERLKSFPPNRISLRTLTTERYTDKPDPHVDPIKPDNPLKVPLFATRLMLESMRAQYRWKIAPEVKGYVFLSGPNDTYVNAAKTIAVLKRNTPHFQTMTFDAALHEIDNEVPSIASRFAAEAIQFLNSTT